MGKKLTLTSPIKVASSPSAVTADKLSEGQVAIYDDGTGALGIVGKAGGRLLRSPTGGNATQGKVPITLVTGPGYFAAPHGTIDPATDCMVFYTMGCRSSSRRTDGQPGKSIHITKKRFARMGKTTAVVNMEYVWKDRLATNECVTAALTKVERNAPRGTMDFFTANLSSMQAELLRKFTMEANTNQLYFRLGSRRRRKTVQLGTLYAGTELVRFTIGVAIERDGNLATDIYPVHVAISTTADINIAENYLMLCLNIQLGGSIGFTYTPVRRLATRWEQPET